MAKTESPDDVILNALRKALANLPAQLPPQGKEGLFLGGAKGKELLDRAVAEGYLRVDVEKVKSGRSIKTIQKAVVLEKGLHQVLAVDSPKTTLEALLPAVQALSKQPPGPRIEDFRQELDRATTTCLDAMNAAFANLQAAVLKVVQPAASTLSIPTESVIAALEQTLQRVKPPPSLPVTAPAAHDPAAAPAAHTSANLEGEIGQFVDAWVKEKSVGCSFDVLWNHLRAHHAQLTIGEFQDALRKLHDAHRIRLGGWPRMLDDLPEPQLALLVSSKVMYYAQPASGIG